MVKFRLLKNRLNSFSLCSGYSSLIRGSIAAYAKSTRKFINTTATAIREGAETNAHLLAALVAVPALVGFVVQHICATKKIKKKLKPGGGDG